MSIAKILNALTAAWNMLLDWPLPPSIQNAFSSESQQDEDGELTLLAFPLVGLIFGFIFLLAGKLSTLFLGDWAGGVLFALAATAATEAGNRGRGFCSTVSFAANWAETGDAAKALNRLGDSWRTLSGVAPTLTAFGYIALKLVCFTLLCRYRCQWLLAIYVLDFAAQGFLATDKALGLPVAAAEKVRVHVWFPVIFILLFFIGHPAAPLLAFGAVFGGSYLFGRYCRNFSGGLNTEKITLFGSFCELAALAVGTLALF
ncbi:MAG: hypothetical protein PHI85_04830 [Victivallaceae bacterium]|nr:hypothetical protein [Victivallaceae bacterium]